jgi:non-canonical purine NTP pyrophosphatase (RdgB/HAM1 family)
VSAPRKIVLASRNVDKVRELQEICTDLPFEVVPAADYDGLPDVVEDGTTCEGNATRKALVTAAWTGEIAVADDTCLQVRELNGLPDVFAARFSGPGATYESNADLLLELMRDVPDGSRQARFLTACVWIDPRPPRGLGPVTPPAASRWLHNPWARAVELKDPAEEEAFWNAFVDRRRVWRDYRAQLLADLVSWGHDRDRVHRIAEELMAGVLDASGPPDGSVRLPDPRIWWCDGPDSGPPPTHVAPAGLDREAPGRAANADHFLEIRTEGRVLGTISREKRGAGGFGYDPLFRPEGREITLAEMEPADKNALSHRGRALRRLLAAVRGAYDR